MATWSLSHRAAPASAYNAIKPDIGAPGASLSAEYGTGNGQTAFGGTSGAAPMVSGSARPGDPEIPRHHPARSQGPPDEYRRDQYRHQPGWPARCPAPITRIGGGEVRVDQAVATNTAAWDVDDLTGSLSFGYAGSDRFQSLPKDGGGA